MSSVIAAAPVFAALFLGESLTIKSALGGLLIVAGAVLLIK